MRLLLFLLGAAVSALLYGAAWQTDVLGEPFEMRYVEQADDYAGPVRSTVVRLKASQAQGVGALYVHGFNDYFFQAEEAGEFAAHGYDFYAVDLRKYGRSLLPGQRRFQARDLREYFADIDSALAVMREDGIRDVVLVGHSTGGLITSLYMAGHPAPEIRCLVLNSPFLDWNQSKVQERILIPAVRTMAPLMPNLDIPQGNSRVYSNSLLRGHGGEWDFDTTWKLPVSPPVEASWIAAIDEAHDVVQRAPDIRVPVLVMHSDASGKTAAEASHTDVVLDVTDIARYGRGLGPAVTVVTVPGGMHDLALSAPAVRAAMYDYLFAWLWGVCPPLVLPYPGR